MPAHDFSDIGDVLDFDVRRGSITAINAASDTCTVSVGGQSLSGLLFYHCTSTSGLRDNGAINGAARGFRVGDQVLVLKRHDNEVVKVIGHVYGKRRCTMDDPGNYYVFSKAGSDIKITRLDADMKAIGSQMGSDVFTLDPTGETFQFTCKRFSLNIDGEVRDAYFIATSLQITEDAYPGWKTFREANPGFGLCPNTQGDSKITMTDQVWTDLNAVNLKVNSEHGYSPDIGDTWSILGPGEPGDCVANYEQIYTKDGVKKVGDLKVGDVVLSYDLTSKQYCYKPITKIWEKGRLEGKRVGLKNGQHVDVSEGHPMWVRTNQGHSRNGKEISRYEKRYFKDIDLSRWWKRRLPIVKKLPYQVNDIDWLTEDMCFIAGHYLAEGWKEGSHVSSCGHDIVDRILPLLNKAIIPYSEYKNNSGVPCVRYLKSDFKEFLKTLKSNSFDIHLPEKLFHLPENKLMAILDGYWVGDGHNGNYAQKTGCACNKQEVYSTSSYQWATDLQRIGLHLGKSFHVWKQVIHQGIGTKPIYRVAKNDNSHFYHDHGYEGLSEIGIARKHIEDIGLVEMRDFEVEGTHTFIFKNGLVCHQCEDFALTKANELLNLGYPASALHIEAGAIVGPPTRFHAWLVVQTDQGNFALDNNVDQVVLNKLLTCEGKDIVARKRQIGGHWAFVSSYGWSSAAVNTDRLCTYILDPKLNVMYSTKTTNVRFFEKLANGSSVNFSQDNDGIYIAANFVDSGFRVMKITIANGEAVLLSNVSPHPAMGYVNRSGQVVYPGASVWEANATCIVVSEDGYYRYVRAPSIVISLAERWWDHTGVMSSALISDSDDEYIWCEDLTLNYWWLLPENKRGYNYHTPFGETRHNDAPIFMGHIHDTGIMFQSFGWESGGKRAYLNKASVLTALCTQAECTETDYMGLAYIPWTDRL